VPLQAEIRCECAFTYMNAVFRKNLTDARHSECERRAHRALRRRRLRRCHRHRGVSPDERDIHVGRERPPKGRAWGEEGGSQMEVAHAPAVALLGATLAPTSLRRHRTPPARDRRSLAGKDIEPRSLCGNQCVP
jgi:hypothetical protein